MKYRAGFITLPIILAFLFGGCVSSATKATDTISTNGTPPNQNSDSNIKISAEKSARFPLVFVGVIVVYRGDVKFGGLSEADANDNFAESGEPKVGTTVEMDVLNCAGFLSSAVAVYDEGWKLKLKPFGAAPDLAEKVQRCGKNDDEENLGSDIIVIPFGDENRKSIKTEKKLDVQKAFASLPAEEQKWAEEDGESLSQNRHLIEKHIGYGWTDADGNGEIDVLVISGGCQSEKPDSAQCQKVLRLTGGQWKEIARIGFAEAAAAETYSKEPEILSGAVEILNGKLSFGNEKNGSVWQNGDSRYGVVPVAIPIGTIKEVAIVNCAGYLASAKAEKIRDEPFAEQADLYSWRLKLILQSVAVDAAAKVKKCAAIQASEKPDLNRAFALFQFSPDLKKTRVNLQAIGKPDLKRLYESLPDELKKWLKAGEEAEGIEPRAKGAIDLKTDAWADVDGDGKVDLIEVYGVCSGARDGDYSCTRIWRLIGDEWKEISFNTPL